MDGAAGRVVIFAETDRWIQVRAQTLCPASRYNPARQVLILTDVLDVACPSKGYGLRKEVLHIA